jgi:hypothetical protein
MFLKKKYKFLFTSKVRKQFTNSDTRNKKKKSWHKKKFGLSRIFFKVNPLFSTTKKRYKRIRFSTILVKIKRKNVFFTLYDLKDGLTKVTVSAGPFTRQRLDIEKTRSLKRRLKMEKINRLLLINFFLNCV